MTLSFVYDHGKKMLVVLLRLPNMQRKIGSSKSQFYLKIWKLGCNCNEKKSFRYGISLNKIYIYIYIYLPVRCLEV